MSNAFCYVLVSDEVVHARVDNKVVLCFLVTMSRLRCGPDKVVFSTVVSGRAGDQAGELFGEHHQSEQHHQPLQHGQPEGAGSQEEEEEELGEDKMAAADRPNRTHTHTQPNKPFPPLPHSIQFNG